MGEHILQVEHNEGSEIGIHIVSLLVLHPIREVNFIIRKVINSDLQVTRVKTGNYLSYCHFCSDQPVVIGQQLVQPLVERRTEPIHTVVNCVFNCWVPVFLRQRIGVSNDVADGMTVLETSKFTFAVSHSQNQIAGPLGSLHSVDRLVQSCIPLKNVSEDESERVAHSTFLSEGFIRIGYPDF